MSAFQPTELSEGDVIEVAKLIIAWYQKYRRALPWRGDKPPYGKSRLLSSERLAESDKDSCELYFNPYGQWISEVMLQQTRVEAVIPFWLRWMEKFPTVEALAEASEETVLTMWSGLGFYNRVRNIHKGAKFIVSEYNGILPDDPEKLKKIPGIGDYTAGAICSCSYRLPEPLVDGNVVRVFCRVFGLPLDAKSSATIKLCWDIAYRFFGRTKAAPGTNSKRVGKRKRADTNGEAAIEILTLDDTHGNDFSTEKDSANATRNTSAAASQPIPQEENSLTPYPPVRFPGAFNQGLMELGATVCIPTNPTCDLCPLGRRGLCMAFAEGMRLYAGAECIGNNDSTTASPSRLVHRRTDRLTVQLEYDAPSSSPVQGVGLVRGKQNISQAYETSEVLPPVAKVLPMPPSPHAVASLPDTSESLQRNSGAESQTEALRFFLNNGASADPSPVFALPLPSILTRIRTHITQHYPLPKQKAREAKAERGKGKAADETDAHAAGNNEVEEWIQPRLGVDEDMEKKVMMDTSDGKNNGKSKGKNRVKGNTKSKTEDNGSVMRPINQGSVPMEEFLVFPILVPSANPGPDSDSDSSSAPKPTVGHLLLQSHALGIGSHSGALLKHQKHPPLVPLNFVQDNPMYMDYTQDQKILHLPLVLQANLLTQWFPHVEFQLVGSYLKGSQNNPSFPSPLSVPPSQTLQPSGTAHPVLMRAYIRQAGKPLTIKHIFSHRIHLLHIFPLELIAYAPWEPESELDEGANKAAYEWRLMHPDEIGDAMGKKIVMQAERVVTTVGDILSKDLVDLDLFPFQNIHQRISITTWLVKVLYPLLMPRVPSLLLSSVSSVSFATTKSSKHESMKASKEKSPEQLQKKLDSFLSKWMLKSPAKDNPRGNNKSGNDGNGQTASRSGASLTQDTSCIDLISDSEDDNAFDVGQVHTVECVDTDDVVEGGRPMEMANVEAHDTTEATPDETPVSKDSEDMSEASGQVFLEDVTGTSEAELDTWRYFIERWNKCGLRLPSNSGNEE